MTKLSFKLAFRADEPAGVVRCYLSALDDSERDEIATMSLALLRKVPGLFDSWAAVMKEAYRVALAECGLEVVGFQEFRPGDKN